MDAESPQLAARIGYRLAQIGAGWHVLGGLLDLTQRELQPFHVAYLGAAAGSAPVATFILTLLRALGAALMVSGIAQLVLLRRLRAEGGWVLGVVVALLALGCEGSVGANMLWLGFGFGAIPLVSAALVAGGVALMMRAAGRQR